MSNSDLGSFPSHNSAFAQAVKDFCLRNYTPPADGLRNSFPSSPVWKNLVEAGSIPWLDTGDIDAIQGLWTREFTALTTNNTLLNKEVQKGIYDALVPEAAQMLRAADAAISDELLVLEIAFILNAVHGLKLVSTFDADVSVELHTLLARNAEATYHYGKRFQAICPDRFIVKVPLTPEGLLGARRLSDDGIRLNFTLGFSARQNYLIARLARPLYVNVFMGRNGAFVKDNGLGDGVHVGEKATLSSQRMLRALTAKTGVEVRQIGASIRNGQQVFDLLGLDVFTIPTGAAKEYLELNPAPDTVVDRTGNDPEVQFADNAPVDQLAKMWEVSDGFQAAVDSIEFSDSLTGDEVRAQLKAKGAGDIFPTLTADELGRVAAESKIPKADSWRDKVDAGEASWDGLLTEAALQSFHIDQTALDDRIRKSL